MRTNDAQCSTRSPSPLPSPSGRGRIAASLTKKRVTGLTGRLSENIQPRACCSLSPRERVRVRGNGPNKTSSCLFLALVSLLSGPGFAIAEKSLGDLTGPWELLLDDHLVATKVNVVRKYHEFKKHPNNPLIISDQPWEGGMVRVGSVLPNEDGDGYRMWYSCWTTRNDPDKGHTLYALSKDGIRWDKPKMNLMPWKVTGSTENNIIPGGGWVLHTPHETDPALRYKAIGSAKSGGYVFKASSNGLHWATLSKSPIFHAGDTCRVMWDPLANKYRGYAKVNATVSGMRRRAIGYSEGTGFESWPAMRLIMAPDDFDDRWAVPGSIQRTHFYVCPVFAYQNMYIGFLSIFRGEDAEGYFHGPVFIELVTSRDGVHWLRQEGDRPPILPCGPARSWDHGMISAASLVVVGDEMRMYYAGYDGLHDYLPFHSAIGVATLRKDGFASLDGEDNPGTVTTKLLKGLRGKLRLNCEAGAGLLQVEVLDADGKTVPGYGKMDCNEPRGDGLDQIVTWAEHDELPAGGAPLRLKFYLKNASLYAFKTDGVVQLTEEPSSSSLAALFTFEGDGGKWISNKLSPDGNPKLHFLGTSKIDRKQENAAFGSQSVTVASQWRPLNTLQITGTTNLGTQFTIAVMAQNADNQPARLFSSYNGNKPVNVSELVFDYDPSGRVLAGLRLIAKGIPVMSKSVSVADKKYHHLCVTYNDGHVKFYVDGNDAGEAWLPNGAPVTLARDLLVGEDAELGSDEQFNGNMDDILVMGRVLNAEDIKQLAVKGSEAILATAPRAK